MEMQENKKRAAGRTISKGATRTTKGSDEDEDPRQRIDVGPKNEVHDLNRKYLSNREKWGARNKIHETKREIPVPTILTNNGKPYTEAIFIEPNDMDERLMEFN